MSDVVLLSNYPYELVHEWENAYTTAYREIIWCQTSFLSVLYKTIHYLNYVHDRNICNTLKCFTFT
jgi:hypothetical protein